MVLLYLHYVKRDLVNLMDKEELVELFGRFLCEHGQWIIFKEWVEAQGY